MADVITEARKQAERDAAQLTQDLRWNVIDEATFRVVEQKVKAHPFGLCFEGKRNGYELQAFTPLPWNPNKAHYLVCDGVHTGRCQWRNLWKVAKVGL